MSTEIFSTLGKIAGLAGLSIGLILYVIFRVIKSIEKNNTQNNQQVEEKFKLFRLIISGVFGIGIVGIITWGVVMIQTSPKESNKIAIKNTDSKDDDIGKDSSIVQGLNQKDTSDNTKSEKIKGELKYITDSLKYQPKKFVHKTEIILSRFDSLKYITLKKLQDFDFKARQPLISLIFKSDLLNYSKILKVPLKMKCSELREKLVTELKLNELIILKDGEILKSFLFYPSLKWGTMINYSNVSSEDLTFKQLKIYDSAKLSLNYKWETANSVVQTSPFNHTNNNSALLKELNSLGYTYTIGETKTSSKFSLNPSENELFFDVKPKSPYQFDANYFLYGSGKAYDPRMYNLNIEKRF